MPSKLIGLPIAPLVGAFPVHCRIGSLENAGCDELRQASFAEAVTLLLDSFRQLIKRFGDEIAAPVAAALEAFMMKIPSIFRRPMLLPACIF
jgi:hypothetical protein